MSAKIAQALHSVMERVGYVQKAKTNDFHKYKYAGEADLLQVLRPAMVEAGLLLIPSVTEVRDIDEYGNTTIIMEYRLVHKDGDEWPHPIRVAGVGGDRQKTGGVGDKGLYKALTGANKYLLFKLFQIETGDDPESDSSHERNQTKPNPKPEYTAGGITQMHPRTRVNPNGVKSSAEMKREGAWETVKTKIEGAVSPEGIKMLKESLQDEMYDERWPANWQNRVHELIDEREEEILAAMNPISAG